MSEAAAANPPPKSGAMRWILIVLILVVAGAAGTWYLGQRTAQSEAAAARPGPAQYYKLDPAFVVNFEAEQLVRFLQVTVEVMTRDAATLELLKHHDPVIRNDLLLLLGNQRYDEIATRAGKEKLREAALETVRRIVTSEGGRPAAVEAVYFTSFVMQ